MRHAARLQQLLDMPSVPEWETDQRCDDDQHGVHGLVLLNVYGEINEFDETSIKSTGYVNNKGD
jgi:hypothetical protein